MPIDDERRSRLNQAKLTSIVRDRFGDEPAVTGTFPSGATLLRGDRAWILVEDLTARSAGGPLLWASRQGATSVDLIVDDPKAVPAVVADVARRLGGFDLAAACWRVEGTDSSRSTRADPRGPRPTGRSRRRRPRRDPVAPPTSRSWSSRASCGARCWASRWRASRRRRVGLRLDVGVGKFDQVAAAMMYAEKSTADALDTVVGVVRSLRYPGAPPHPVRDLCRERWVRSAVMAAPDLVGASELTAIETTVPRENLRDSHPALAWCQGTVVASTHGVDVDLLPLAADVRARVDPDAELVVASAMSMPPAVLGLADHLPGGVRFVRIDAPWA